MTASAFTSPLAPIAPPSSPGSDPFAGAQFGFQVPPGNPGAIRTAGAQAAGVALGLTGRASDVKNAEATATAGWSGHAQGNFSELAGRTVSAFTANADAFTRAGQAMGKLADALEHVQQFCEQAITECEQYNIEQTTQTGLAAQHTADAQGYDDAAAHAPHPAAQHALAKQSRQATDAADTANQAARAAGDQLHACAARARDAITAYQADAHGLASEISAAGDQIKPLVMPAGGAGIPIMVSRGDIQIAIAVWPKVRNLPAGEDNPGKTLDRAAGRHLTPAQIAVLTQMSQHARREDKQGSIIDGLGGFVSGETGGLVSFGDPNTSRYQGGEDASWIPFTPESVEQDADRGLAKVGEDTAGDGDRAGFVTTPRGTTFDIPRGYEPREAANGKGIVYQRPGTPGNAGSIRIMEPTEDYPRGYFRYYNQRGRGQPLDINGKPGGPQATHIPEDHIGEVKGWPR